MNKHHIELLIDQYSRASRAHDSQFAGDAIHADCQERFAKVIEQLQKQLDQFESDPV